MAQYNGKTSAEINGQAVEARLWEKHGKRIVFFSLPVEYGASSFERSKADCGSYDLNAQEWRKDKAHFSCSKRNQEMRAALIAAFLSEPQPEPEAEAEAPAAEAEATEAPAEFEKEIFGGKAKATLILTDDFAIIKIGRQYKVALSKDGKADAVAASLHSPEGLEAANSLINAFRSQIGAWLHDGIDPRYARLLVVGLGDELDEVGIIDPVAMASGVRN